MLFSFKISNLPFVKGPVVTTHHSKNSTHILAICSIILMLYSTYIIFIEETVGRPKLTTCGKHDINAVMQIVRNVYLHYKHRPT